MADAGDKPGASLAFSFQKKKTVQKVAVNVEERKDNGQLISGFDGAKAQVVGDDGAAPRALVIPKLENTFQAGVGPKKFTPSFKPPSNDAVAHKPGEDKFVQAASTVPVITEYGLQRREAPAAAAAADGEGGGGGAANGAAAADAGAPGGAAGGAPGGGLTAALLEERAYKEAVESLPDVADEEAYEAMPVEAFGMAMLRGMGWEEGMGVGRNRRKVEAIEYVRRPERLGLGALPVAVAEDKSRPVKMGDKPRRQDMVLPPDADGRQRHVRKLDEQLVSRAVSAPGPKPGKAMRITGGPHSGLACVAVEALEGAPERWRVRLALSHEEVEVPRADLGEKWQRGGGGGGGEEEPRGGSVGPDAAGGGEGREQAGGSRHGRGGSADPDARAARGGGGGGPEPRGAADAEGGRGASGSGSGRRSRDRSRSREREREDGAGGGGKRRHRERQRSSEDGDDGDGGGRGDERGGGGGKRQRARNDGGGERERPDAQAERERQAEREADRDREGDRGVDRREDEGRRGGGSKRSKRDRGDRAEEGEEDARRRGTEEGREKEKERRRERKEGRRKEKRHKHSRGREADRGGSGEEEEAAEAAAGPAVGPSWLFPHIQVRIVDKRVRGGKLYLKKGVLLDVHPGATADVAVDDTRDVLRLPQSSLETVVPKREGAAVLVVGGPQRGQRGRLLQINASAGAAAVQLVSDFSIARLLLDDVAGYVGDMEE